MQRFYFLALNVDHLHGVHAEVMIGNYEDEHPYEFSVRWHGQQGSNGIPAAIVPALFVYDDAWKFLYEHNLDVLEMLARYDDKEISVQAFCAELEKLNIPMLAQIG